MPLVSIIHIWAKHGLIRRVCCLQDLEYPQMHRLMLHPCVSNEERSIDCGNFFSTTSILRFQSFFTQKRVVASYTFEVRRRPSISCYWAPSHSMRDAAHHMT